MWKLRVILYIVWSSFKPRQCCSYLGYCYNLCIYVPFKTCNKRCCLCLPCRSNSNTISYGMFIIQGAGMCPDSFTNICCRGYIWTNSQLAVSRSRTQVIMQFACQATRPCLQVQLLVSALLECELIISDVSRCTHDQRTRSLSNLSPAYTPCMKAAQTFDLSESCWTRQSV